MRWSLLLLSTYLGCATAIDPRSETTDAARFDATERDAGNRDAVQLVDATLVDARLVDATSTSCAYSGVLATWDFTGASGSQAATAGLATAPGMTVDSITRAPGLTSAAGATSINSSNWPVSAQVDTTKYYTFSIAAPAGCSMHVTALAVDVKSSATGPANAAVASSADGFTQTTAVSTSVPSAPTISATATSLEIRVYGYNASQTVGTMRVQNSLSITGTLQ
jgi:hypothetical protein